MARTWFGEIGPCCCLPLLLNLLSRNHVRTKKGCPVRTHLVLISVLVEYVGGVLAVLPDGDEALLHVEGAARRQDEVQSRLGARELARLGTHPCKLGTMTIFFYIDFWS